VARGIFNALVVWTIAGVLLRSSATRLLAIAGVTPDLLVILTVYWALAGGASVGVITGFVVGLVADAEVGRFLGLSAGTLAGVGFLVGSVGSSLHREKPPAQFVVLFTAPVFVLGVRALFATGGDVVAWFAIFPVEVVLRAVYTAALGPMFYILLRALGVPDFLRHGTSATQS
jgi:rod shape-determining protein MreD